MPGLSLAQIRTQVQDAHSELRQTERALEEASAAASRQYKKTLSVLADGVDAITERVRAAGPEERRTPIQIQIWLNMTLIKLSDYLEWQSDQLRHGVGIESEMIIFDQTLEAAWFREIRQDERVTSWLKEHRASIQDHLARVVQERLREKQVVVNCKIGLLLPGPFYQYEDARIEEVASVDVDVTVTFT